MGMDDLEEIESASTEIASPGRTEVIMITKDLNAESDTVAHKITPCATTSRSRET